MEMLIYLLFCFCKVMINDLNLFVFSSRFKNQKESAEVNIVNWFSFLPSFGFPPFQLTFSSLYGLLLNSFLWKESYFYLCPKAWFYSSRQIPLMNVQSWILQLRWTAWVLGWHASLRRGSEWGYWKGNHQHHEGGRYWTKPGMDTATVTIQMLLAQE